MDYLIKNVYVLTMNKTMDVYSEGAILIEGDTITAVAEGAALQREESRPGLCVIDGCGAIAAPGFLNAHTHSGMIPFRSLGDDCADRLRRFLLPLENRTMTGELAALSARYACAEMLLSGVSCFVDMYYFEDALASAVKSAGIRAFLGETVIGEPVCDSGEPYGGLILGKRFIEKWRGDELICPMIAPHATNTNSPEKIREAAALARRYDVPVTMHVSEMDYEMAYFHTAHAMTPIAFLDSLGVLSPRFIAVHCIHADPEDIRILARSGAAVAHCIGANTKSAKGVAPVKEMLEAGVRVALGTDGPASGNTLDMFTQFDLFAKFHKTARKDRTLFPASEILALATSGAAAALGIGDRVGSIEPGKKADIVLVETASVNMFPCFDPYSVLVYSAKAANVDTVFVNGRLLVRNKKLTGRSLPDIRRDLDEAMGDFRREAAVARKNEDLHSVYR
jgi:cytosine/adenosine deaminase-related metal-dependent hydrolase